MTCARCGEAGPELCGRCGGNLKVGDIVTFGDEPDHPRMQVIELRGASALVAHLETGMSILPTSVYLLADLEPL